MSFFNILTMGIKIDYYRVSMEPCKEVPRVGIFNLYLMRRIVMNGNNPKGGNPNQPQNKQGQGQEQGQKQGQSHGQNPGKQGQGQQQGGQHNPNKQAQQGQEGQQQKNGWCGAHKGPKSKCNCA
jgi:hypothetical protein